MFWGRFGLSLTLLSLCSFGAGAHHSDHLCMRRSFWKELIHGLEKTNPILSPKCRTEYEKRLQLPTIVKPAKQDRTPAAIEILKGIQKLFSEPNIPLPKKERQVFLNSVSEILSQLQSCVKSTHSDYIYQADIQERFKKLRDFIKQKENSRCAWEIVHAVTREILQTSAIHHTTK
ncbi:uncharacterized protein [Hemitrygon akajei]|uniref:uncharacterized protein n=1 Tax=Hemitrygon akajei TaxID=2704970 RepID=UPI003BFA3549